MERTPGYILFPVNGSRLPFQRGAAGRGVLLWFVGISKAAGLSRLFYQRNIRPILFPAHFLFHPDQSVHTNNRDAADDFHRTLNPVFKNLDMFRI